MQIFAFGRQVTLGRLQDLSGRSERREEKRGFQERSLDCRKLFKEEEGEVDQPTNRQAERGEERQIKFEKRNLE